jgi:hypothetical protein
MQLVELYHHGTLFGRSGAFPLRAWAEDRADWNILLDNFAVEPREIQTKVVHYLAVLLSCPFCEAPWACGVAAVLWLFGGTVGHVVVIALAASRLANLVNDLTHGWCRSPQEDAEEVSEVVE